MQWMCLFHCFRKEALGLNDDMKCVFRNGVAPQLLHSLLCQ